MGYEKIPALAQVLLVFERLNQLRWEWIFTGKVRGANGYAHCE